MLSEEALKTFFPVIMTPSHDGKTFVNYTSSIIQFTTDAIAKGLRHNYIFHPGASLITRARNNCVATFLQNPEWTHLFWIDSDIGFSPEAAYRLLLSDYDVAAGVYPLKRHAWPAQLPVSATQAQFETLAARYPLNAEPDAQGIVDVAIQPDGFIKVREAPTGFMVIKRRVFELLIRHYPHLRYVPDYVGIPDDGLHYRFFDVMMDEVTNRYLSEDYGFCRLWEKIGGAIHVDANSTLTHEGQKTFRGNLPASLRENLAYTVGAPPGHQMVLSGTQYLKANPPGPGSF